MQPDSGKSRVVDVRRDQLSQECGYLDISHCGVVFPHAM
jgi:hypothetical protein